MKPCAVMICQVPVPPTDKVLPSTVAESGLLLWLEFRITLSVFASLLLFKMYHDQSFVAVNASYALIIGILTLKSDLLSDEPP